MKSENFGTNEYGYCSQHMKWLQQLQILWSTCVISDITASCPISKGSLRLPNVAFRRSINTMSLMAFCITIAPKLTCGFPLRTKVLQLPGSFATSVTLLLPRSRTLTAWLKGHSSMPKGRRNSLTISGQRGPLRPHPAAFSVANFPHPVKGLRRSCAWLNCGVLETSKNRSAGKGHSHFNHLFDPLTGSICWRKSALTNSTCVPERSTCWIFDHLAITAASPTTFRLANSSLSNLSSFAKDFSSPDTAVFDKWRYSSSVALAKAAKSPVTSVPVRSRWYRRLALDKASNWPPTRVWRSRRPLNSVLLAKTSNEPETFAPLRSRYHNVVSFEISRCSEPPRSRRPRKLISSISQLSLRYLGFAGHRNRGTNPGNLTTFPANFFVPKIVDPFFCCTAKGLRPSDTRKVVRTLQFCFWYSQISEHHLEQFLLGAPFSFSFIHIRLNAWDLCAGGSTARDRSKNSGRLEMPIEMKQEFNCFHF